MLTKEQRIAELERFSLKFKFKEVGDIASDAYARGFYHSRTLVAEKALNIIKELQSDLSQAQEKSLATEVLLKAALMRIDYYEQDVTVTGDQSDYATCEVLAEKVKKAEAENALLRERAKKVCVEVIEKNSYCMECVSSTAAEKFFAELNTPDNSGGWIRTKDSLPEEKKYVLARASKANWFDSDDQKNVCAVIVKLVRGISEEDRANLPEGNVRKKTYKFGDEQGNNLVAYQWDTFGPSSFFGQEITHWRPLPTPPESTQSTNNNSSTK